MDEQSRTRSSNEEPVEELSSESRHRRECRISGFADLLPDWILPPEGKQHVRNARKEMLLAVRSVLDAAIERQDRPPRGRRMTSRIEIE